jgi:hypothetical protein
MYSGFTISNHSGSWLGVHQKVDRIASKIVNDQNFDIKRILHFEGRNGPDGIKNKSPGQDEPWHFFNPFEDDHSVMLGHLQHHYDSLVHALKISDKSKAAFESAWLAHAITDGLTPAHHYPYATELETLRGGEDRHTRTSIKTKLVMPGDTVSEKISNNWQAWGPGGVISAHGIFEYGVAFTVISSTFSSLKITESNQQKFDEIGYREWFVRSAKHIYALDMYRRFIRRGWTLKLIREVKAELMPTIIKTVAMTWAAAAAEANAKCV